MHQTMRSRLFYVMTLRANAKKKDLIKFFGGCKSSRISETLILECTTWRQIQQVVESLSTDSLAAKETLERLHPACLYQVKSRLKNSSVGS